MKSINNLMSILTLVAMIGTASAQRNFLEIYKECGMGGNIAPSDPILAITTNVIADYGLTAIASELSSPELCKGDSSRMAAFILDAHPKIEQDLAVGEGLYLSSIISLMGCKGSEAEATLALRREFSSATVSGYFNVSELEKSEILFHFATKTSDQICTI